MLVIRLAAPSNIPQIMQLINEIVPVMIAAGNMQWDSTYPNVEVFKNDIALSQLWVADIEGRIAGVLAITTDNEPEYAEAGLDINEPAIVTHRLAVSLLYRGRGLAAALLNKADEVALSRNISVLRIDTSADNQVTQKLFPKAGYVFAGEIDLPVSPGQRFYCYEKRLSL